MDIKYLRIVSIVILALLQVVPVFGSELRSDFNITLAQFYQKSYSNQQAIFDSLKVNIFGIHRNFNTFLRIKFGRFAKLDYESLFVTKEGIYKCHIENRRKVSTVLIDLFNNEIRVIPHNGVFQKYDITDKGNFKSIKVSKNQLHSFLRDKNNPLRKSQLSSSVKKYLHRSTRKLKEISYYVINGNDNGFFDITAVKKNGNNETHMYVIGSGAFDKLTSMKNMFFYMENYKDLLSTLVNLLNAKGLISSLEHKVVKS